MRQPTPLLPLQIPVAARDVLIERLRADLLGPLDGNDQEVLSERPSDRYLTGILFPSGEKVPPNEDEALAAAMSDDADEGADDSPAPLSGALRPSSCGISFALSSVDAPELVVRVNCARYERLAAGLEPRPRNRKGERAARPKEHWQRIPLSCEFRQRVVPNAEPVTVDMTDYGLAGLEVYFRASRTDGVIIVTVVLVNCLGPGDDRTTSEANSFFQTALRVSPVSPAALAVRPNHAPAHDRDARIAQLIYRHAQEYAVGHTCSTAWGPKDTHPEWVHTDWMPHAIVRRMRAEGDPVFDVLRTDPQLRPLDAEWQSEQASDVELVSGLERVAEQYGRWLSHQEAEAASLPVSLQSTATENLRECRAAESRIKQAVGLIASDSVVRQAWRLAVGAMAKQFNWSKGKKLTWHPFQLAFQLLVLPSLAERDSRDRGLMDLLWFPTGGGKTEAYLALTAFVLFYRRLRDGATVGCGTSVLMRYTLRLLTIQQFQRAAALIAACEAIRRGVEVVASVPKPRLGATPFSIGLWVGSGATPNRFEDAKEALLKGGKSTPRQLDSCPKCRARLCYEPVDSKKAIIITCSEERCYFARSAEPLPVWTVDQDIYRERPSLLIATVDKFAQVVRSEEAGGLFGIGTRSLPPDLIIQDELHLISGPLGSLAGLFEVAIDRLCSHQGPDGLVRPKVIGSTATIRRAEEQVTQLFDRQAFQFPPPVIDAENTGFGVVDERDPGRLYVGLTTAGRSAKFVLQATYASLLQGATDNRIQRQEKNSPRDAYWTLTGYFNSLRELGGAVTLVMDDVLKSIRTFARRRANEPERKIAPPVELTSRIPSSDIPRTLASLGIEEGNPGAVDVLLASNMISVGVDISRLGTMVVAAQPKTISEYIQATSRVGRHSPGLVVVVYNHPRVRDRSHFETFPTWHRALYRSVEATSVTPFASRARDKALHAVVVALARHLVDDLRKRPRLNAGAKDAVLSMVNLIGERVGRIDGPEAEATRRKLRVFVDDWMRLTDEGLKDYWNQRDHLKSLLIGAELAVSLDEMGQPYVAWPTPNSMREVEPSSLFRLWFDPALSSRPRRRASSAEE